jgi:hypothetical protein
MDSQSVILFQRLESLFVFAGLPAYLGVRKAYTIPSASKDSVFLSTLTATGLSMLAGSSLGALLKFGSPSNYRFDQMTPLSVLVLVGLFVVICIAIIVQSAISAFAAATFARLAFSTGPGGTSLLAGIGAVLGASILPLIYNAL